MLKKPFKWRVELAAERMLPWIKEEELFVKWTRNRAIEVFRRSHTEFKLIEVKAAMKILFDRGMVRLKEMRIESVSS